MVVRHVRVHDWGGTFGAPPCGPLSTQFCDSPLPIAHVTCRRLLFLFLFFFTVGHRPNQEASSILPEGFAISVLKPEKS